MNAANKKLIVIQGPTASGKTALSVSLAKALDTVVFSADSRQFYKELAIGTAKPSLEEQDGVIHYFIDSHFLTDSLTAASYVKQALPLLEKEFKTKEYIVLCGGSGLFIDALCRGLDDVPVNKGVKIELASELELNGLAVLVEEFRRKDPEQAMITDLKNPMRVIRALEVIRSTGEKYSSFLTHQKTERMFDFIKFTIDLNRVVLYERINLRVDKMMQQGLLDEVVSVLPYRAYQALNTVGYSELFHYLEGLSTLPESIELIKQNTRRYAKRQLTWFRRDKEALWLSSEMVKDQLIEVLNRLKIVL